MTLDLYRQFSISSLLIVLLFAGARSTAQSTKVTTVLDPQKISVGDQARLFIEVHHSPSEGLLQWPAIPDSAGQLEFVKDRIDTIKGPTDITYKQRILITGFDSGSFNVPSFIFTVNAPNPYQLHSDSFQLLVQTLPVDTTKDFKPIKNIIFVRSTPDYLFWIIGGIVFLAIVGIAIYFLTRKKLIAPEIVRPETLTERYIRRLTELDNQQLWQKNKVKEYYIELTDVVRHYIEERFHTPALELTTDEIIAKARFVPDLSPFADQLSNVLYTADMAKFARANPSAIEHTQAMVAARSFVQNTVPVTVMPADNKGSL